MCWRPGETGGYYGDYAEEPIAQLGRALAERLCLSGRALALSRRRAARRAVGRSAADRLCRRSCRTTTRSATRRSASASPPRTRGAASMRRSRSCCCRRRSRSCSWARNGRRTAVHVLLRFRPELADAVREGRRREFAQFAEFGEAAAQGRIPDATEESSFVRPGWTGRSASASRTGPGLSAIAGCCVCGGTRSCRVSPASGRAVRSVGSGRRRCARMDARRRRASAAARQFRRCGGAARRSAVR